MSRRIFIAGERGQVARALYRTYSARGDTVISAGRARMDVADPTAVRSAIGAFRPNLVINAAAYTAVDQAEDDAEAAYRINCDGARYVAATARAAGALLIHLSTDYVFDGRKPTPYLETDTANPLGVYGKSKRAGEEAVAATTADFVTLRTSWIFSAEGNNFVKTLLRLAAERTTIDVVDDQHGAPTFAADLAEGIVRIGETLLAATDRSALCGVYHATAEGRTTRYQFARAILELSARSGGPSCAVRPVATKDYPTRARRPANALLDGSKLATVFGVRLPAWRSGLERCFGQLNVAPRGAGA